MLNLFIKFFVKPFVDNVLTFFDNLFNSFLLKVVLLGYYQNPLFFTKSAISLLLAKFTCLTLALNILMLTY